MPYLVGGVGSTANALESAVKKPRHTQDSHDQNLVLASVGTWALRAHKEVRLCSVQSSSVHTLPSRWRNSEGRKAQTAPYLVGGVDS